MLNIEDTLLRLECYSTPDYYIRSNVEEQFAKIISRKNNQNYKILKKHCFEKENIYETFKMLKDYSFRFDYSAIEVYTSYFSNFRNFPDDAFIYSITRFPAKWFDCENIDILAPEKDILLEYKKGDLSEEEYTKRYNAYLDTLSLYKVIGNIGRRKILFLCYEKTEDFCHRHILCERLNKLGIKCKEL